MKAFRNLIHGGVLGMMAVLGVVFTLKVLFGTTVAFGSLAMVAGFWLWFATYAGGSTALLNTSQSAYIAPLVHGGLYLALHLVPREMPFGILRLGYDLLRM